MERVEQVSSIEDRKMRFSVASVSGMRCYAFFVLTLLLLVSRAHGGTYHEVIRVVDGDSVFGVGPR